MCTCMFCLMNWCCTLAGSRHERHPGGQGRRAGRKGHGQRGRERGSGRGRPFNILKLCLTIKAFKMKFKNSQGDLRVFTDIYF